MLGQCLDMLLITTELGLQCWYILHGLDLVLCRQRRIRHDAGQVWQLIVPCCIERAHHTNSFADDNCTCRCCNGRKTGVWQYDAQWGGNARAHLHRSLPLRHVVQSLSDHPQKSPCIAFLRSCSLPVRLGLQSDALP